MYHPASQKCYTHVGTDIESGNVSIVILHLHSNITNTVAHGVQPYNRVVDTPINQLSQS